MAKSKKSRRKSKNPAAAKNDDRDNITTDYRSFSSPDPLPHARSSSNRSNRSNPRNQHSNNNNNNNNNDHLKMMSLPDWEAVRNVQHRGFSTSIRDMFADPATERVDCCALTCCGILQSDRDRYLLTGVTPPGPMKRLTVHVVLPLSLFVLAGYGATHIADPYLNQTVCVVLLLIMLSFLILQCVKGSDKRTAVRKDLLFTKYQIQQNPQGDRLHLLLEQERPEDDAETGNRNSRTGASPEYYLGQQRRDFTAAHACCLIGCYPNDQSASEEEETLSVNKNNNYNSVCACLYKTCSPSLCGMHVQCCGTCALAQEGRELEGALLPASYRRIDYITMQPYMEYYPAIYQARWNLPTAAGHSGNSIARTSSRIRLSALSRRILQWLAVMLSLALVWSILGPLYWKYVANVYHRTFDIRDFVVLLLTLLESVGVLMLLMHMVNKPKYSELSLDAILKFFASGFLLSTSLAAFWEIACGMVVRLLVRLGLEVAGVDVVENPETSNASQQFLWPGRGNYFLADAAQDFLQSAGKNHPVLYTVYIIIATFLLAALIEELCKYFGYRMVEHPDFLTQEDLEEATEIVLDDNDDDDVSNNNNKNDANSALREFPQQGKSHQARGAAITLAMLSTAMGFTCCENLVYIFVYSGASIDMEVAVLLARAFFPVHAICAALQSLGVVQRDVENTKSRILLPAVLFHGAYDFFIVWIDFLVSRKHKGSSPKGISLLSFFLSVGLMVAAILYFTVQAGRQRRRLIAMDQRATLDQSRLI